MFLSVNQARGRAGNCSVVLLARGRAGNCSVVLLARGRVRNCSVVLLIARGRAEVMTALLRLAPQSIQRGGNKRARELYEATLPANFKRPQDD